MRAYVMTNVHRIPDKRGVEREASEWVARLTADEVLAEDRERFEQWLSAHPGHARAYDELSATWRLLARSGLLVRAVSFGQSMNAATDVPGSRRSWALVAAAAVVAVVAIAGMRQLWQHTDETLFQTAVGEHAEITLPDGSLLDLNSNSLAKVLYSPRARVIRLERGEAFFKVAHDERRPFWVMAANSWVRAVGTEFDVYRKSTSLEVTVNEGTVRVMSEIGEHETPTDSNLAGATVSILTAGEQIDIGGHAAVMRALEPTRLKRSVAWRQGNLYFDDRPLGEVIDEMSRYTTVKIEFGDPTLRQLAVGGTFRATPDGVELLLTLLHEGFGLTVRHQGQERVIVDRTANLESVPREGQSKN
jgi:transmembrane sensor